MDREQIQEIIFRVLAEYGNFGSRREADLEFPVEVSAKHVHLTDEAVEILFGKGKKLTPKRPLSQPGQFLSEERVSIVTPKGRMENVAVLGPARPYVQVELSATDARNLGVAAPLRMSGDLKGAGDVYLIGPAGVYDAKGSAIVAQAHVHLTPADAERAGVADGQRVAVTIHGERQTTFENVICRVSDSAGLAMHIDYDEANACMLPKHATARMQLSSPALCSRKTAKAESDEKQPEGCPAGPTKSGEQCVREKQTESSASDRTAVKTESGGEIAFDGKLITEACARELAARGALTLLLAQGVILTPSARDVFAHEGTKLVWKTGGNSR